MDLGSTPGIRLVAKPELGGICSVEQAPADSAQTGVTAYESVHSVIYLPVQMNHLNFLQSSPSPSPSDLKKGIMDGDT